MSVQEVDRMRKIVSGVAGAGELLPGCTVTVAALCGVLRGAGTSILRPAVAWCAAAASAASSNNEITAPR